MGAAVTLEQSRSGLLIQSNDNDISSIYNNNEIKKLLMKKKEF